MKIFFSLLLTILFCLQSFTQEPEERIDEKVDQITYDWDLEADKLATYKGLGSICTDEEYRTKILGLMSDIHHYDTILYGILTKMSKRSKDKEIKKSLKDIARFEEKYNPKNFALFMRQECNAFKDIESHADDLRNEVGQNSYSGQVYILETELYKYVKHVTASVDRIRQHVHHLSNHY
ncbi:MAG: hypothetical protein AB8B73_06555 [Ekhidna sp.]